MTKPTIFRQCTLRRRDNFGTVHELAEWVPAYLAKVGNLVQCQDKPWRIMHVGEASAEPRAARSK